MTMLQPNGTCFSGWLLNTADNQFEYARDFDGDGRSEILVTGPWGVGILKQSGATLIAQMMQPNGTRFGAWLLNMANDRLGTAADYDLDEKAEILFFCLIKSNKKPGMHLKIE